MPRFNKSMSKFRIESMLFFTPHVGLLCWKVIFLFDESTLNAILFLFLQKWWFYWCKDSAQCQQLRWSSLFFCTYPHIRASKQSCLGGLWTILWLHASTVRSYTEYTYVYRSKVCSINWIHDMWNPNKAGEIFKKIIGGKIIDPNFEFHDKGCKYFCSHNFVVVIFNSWGEKNTFHIMSHCF